MDALKLLVAIARGEVACVSPTVVPAVIDLAIDHRVTAMVQRAVDCGRIDSSSVPEIEKALAAHELRSIARLERLEAASVPVVRRLVDQGCDVMVTKGWWASHMLYERPFERVFSDIDLVVPPGWEWREAELGEVLGPPRAAGRSVRVPADSLAWWAYDLPGVTVDIHRNPFTLEQAAAPDAATIWREHVVAGDHRWGGAFAPTLELALAQLAVNYGKDRLRWLYQLDDLRRLMSRPELNWTKLWELVDLGGVTRPVTSVLAAVVRTLGVDPPPGLGRRSLLMLPWVGGRRILSGRVATAPKLSSAAYRTVAGGGVRPGLRVASSVVLPSSGALASHLEAKSLAARSGYIRGLGALYWHHLKRLTGATPQWEGDTSAAPVWSLTDATARSPAATDQLGDRI